MVNGAIEPFVPVFILRVDSIRGAVKAEGWNAAQVVGPLALGYERSGATTLEIGNAPIRCIARELLVVDSETVALGA